MTTLTIPLVTLPAGSQTFGPSNAADAESKIVLTVDRTVPGGLKSLTSASVVAVDVSQSNDGGVTWQEIAGCTFPGGVITLISGDLTAAALNVNLAPGTSRKLKAVVTVSGPSSVAIAGTLVTT